MDDDDRSDDWVATRQELLDDIEREELGDALPNAYLTGFDDGQVAALLDAATFLLEYAYANAADVYKETLRRVAVWDEGEERLIEALSAFRLCCRERARIGQTLLDAHVAFIGDDSMDPFWCDELELHEKVIARLRLFGVIPHASKKELAEAQQAARRAIAGLRVSDETERAPRIHEEDSNAGGADE